MQDLLRDLAQNFLIPILAGYLGFVWKLMAKDTPNWTAEDRMLLSEFMVAALFIELGYLIPPFWNQLTRVPMSEAEHQAVSFRAVIFVVVVVALVASALALRHYTTQFEMTNEVADFLSSCGIIVLGLLLVFNTLITAALDAQIGPPST